MATHDDSVRQEILKAALRLYRKHGPNGVTMDDVAAATGRSRSSLYYYYKNRYEIFQAVLDTIVEDVAAVIRANVTAAGTLNEKLYAFCTAKLKASEDWKSILNDIWTSLSEDERSNQLKMMTSLHKKLMYQESIIITEILSAAAGRQESRTVTSGEIDMLGFLISSSIRGIRNEVSGQHDPHDMKAAVRMLTDIASNWLNG